MRFSEWERNGLEARKRRIRLKFRPRDCATTPLSPRSGAKDAFNTIGSALEYASQKLADWEIVGSGEWQLALALLRETANENDDVSVMRSLAPGLIPRTPPPVP